MKQPHAITINTGLANTGTFLLGRIPFFFANSIGREMEVLKNVTYLFSNDADCCCCLGERRVHLT
jgi:hypothetical protein